jgi:PPK2 family polyphosphate:nucleotide phosphotransferase
LLTSAGTPAELAGERTCRSSREQLLRPADHPVPQTTELVRYDDEAETAHVHPFRSSRLCESDRINRQLRFAYDLVEPLLVTPGSTVRLRRDFDPGYTDGLRGKAEAGARLSEGIALLADYQDRLAAQDTFGVLFILQGLDAAGKDGTIKHVMSGLNPKGVDVHNFKQPSAEELDHDFLWRYQRALPERGRIGVFNRSHYEEVLVVRVHPELLMTEHLPKVALKGDVWKRRYREINDWEHHLVDNGIRLVKIFLNLSKREQARRFLKRIDDPEKNWKFSPSDIRERERWDEYQRAINAMLSHTSTERAPWYVVPADHKWFTRMAAAAILVRTLAEINPRYPRVAKETLEEMAAARGALLEETSDTGPARRRARAGGG